MQSIILNNNKNYIVKLQDIINIYYDSYYINSEYIDLIYNKNEISYLIKIYYQDNFIPTFILVETNNTNNLILESFENINNNIELYNKIEDLIYELILIIKLKNKETNNTNNKIEFKKDIKNFRNNLEKTKEDFINLYVENSVELKVFSLRTSVEMISDQILKIYEDKRFDIIINNLLSNRIILSNFNLLPKELIIEIKLNLELDILYNIPEIKIISNMLLQDNIIYLIENLEPFKKENNKKKPNNISILYSIYDMISIIYDMINTFGKIQYKELSKLEEEINNIEFLLDINKDKINNKKLLEFFNKEIILKKQNDKNNCYWSKGTGYGNSSTNCWDIDKFIDNTKKKKSEINSKISTLINIIEDNKNLLDIELTDRVLIIFEYYINNNDDNNIIEDMNVIENIKKLINLFENNIKKDKILLKKITNFLEDNLIDHTLLNYSKNIINKNEIIILNEYQQIFNKYILNYSHNFTNFKYENNKNLTFEQILRLNKEFNIIKKSIVLSKDASLFVIIEKDNISKIKFIISGPKDTPYAYGLFVFDVVINKDFPSKPPSVTFVNNGNKRFNPNLYDCGIVCLSLLGTWRGDKGESWNSSTSTLFQILLSIQSQILVDKPYFNEPGYERQMNTTVGDIRSKKYNDNILQYTLDYTINELLEDALNSKNTEYKDIVIDYFKYHHNHIYEQLIKSKYLLDDSNKYKFNVSIDKFTNLTSIFRNISKK
jgi:ubiquitin-protein ligase